MHFYCFSKITNLCLIATNVYFREGKNPSGTNIHIYTQTSDAVFSPCFWIITIIIKISCREAAINYKLTVKYHQAGAAVVLAVDGKSSQRCQNYAVEGGGFGVFFPPSGVDFYLSSQSAGFQCITNIVHLIKESSASLKCLLWLSTNDCKAPHRAWTFFKHELHNQDLIRVIRKAACIPNSQSFSNWSCLHSAYNVYQEEAAVFCVYFRQVQKERIKGLRRQTPGGVNRVPWIIHKAATLLSLKPQVWTRCHAYLLWRLQQTKCMLPAYKLNCVAQEAWNILKAWQWKFKTQVMTNMTAKFWSVRDI